MKRFILLTLVTGSTLLSCSKKSNPKPQQQPTQVTITDSVKIGNQFWTTTNYDGPGGVVYANASAPNPGWGKLYTYTEAKALILPKGWRLPTVDDFTNLLKAEGATFTDPTDGYIYADSVTSSKLMASTGWSKNFGTNSSGFNAIAAGVLGPNGNLNDFNMGYGTGTRLNTTFVGGAFMSSSTFSDPNNLPLSGGNACMFIYQDYQSGSALTETVITSFNTLSSLGSSHASLRFVRDN